MPQLHRCTKHVTVTRYSLEVNDTVIHRSNTFFSSEKKITIKDVTPVKGEKKIEEETKKQTSQIFYWIITNLKYSMI